MSTTSRSGRRPVLTAMIALVLVLLLAACASAGSAAAPQPAGLDGGFLGGGDPAVGGGGSEAERPAAEGPVEAPVVDDQGSAIAMRDGALIVRTGTLGIEVTDFDAALAKARTAITGLGGYISGSQMATDGDQPYASITYRIPSERWDDALTALKDLGSKVLNEQTQAVEVTSAVIDLDARIENLKVTEASLQAIMAQATRIPDILEVQTQLTQVRGQIEQLEAEKAHLEEQASYGTLTVGWSVPVVAVATVQGEWDPAAIVDEALAMLVQLGQGLFTAGIWLAIVGLPLLLVGIVIVGIVLMVGRRLSRPSRGGPAPAVES